MTTALIIGSGAAAAGAALALSHRESLKITVIDIGLQLEDDREELIEALASSSPGEWDEQAVELISKQPVAARRSGVPEKRVFGSDYPFRNVGQLGGLTMNGGANASLISPAYGGFSNVWGSQVMPFAAAAFEGWPVGAATMRCHYEAILRQIPFAGEEDDLAARFPLMRPPAPLPPMSPRSQRVLNAYEKHRSRINGHGVTIGKARLAFDAEKCTRCGMCMTGCPYGLIYSAAQTFDALRRAGRVTFHGGFLALKIIEEDGQAAVITREIATGRTRRFEADRVYVACGAIGTTRLVVNSLGLFDVDVPMLESRQFVLPALSLHATEDPRNKHDFTLNQFNVIVAPGGGSADISTLHFYTFNPAFIDGLPSPLRASSAEWLQVQLLRRLTVALGYLPSWNSSRLRLHIGSRPGRPELPDLHISSHAPPPGQRRMLRAVILRLIQSARLLDLYPLLPMVRLSAAGKSYHWGGSFPHGPDNPAIFSSDRLGRVGSWERIHLVDASVFPTVPAMTFGLTVMANAHRIASESLELISC
jgi:choline dehydrogenase-like flavoprotein